MRRREFIIDFLMVGLITLPTRGIAQSSKRIWRVGIIGVPSRLDSLRQGFEKLGYIEGENLRLEYRLAEGHAERYPALAAELVQLPVDAIVAVTTPAVLAARKATDTIPIVMVTGAPLGADLIQSLAHPAGNVTGLSSQSGEAESKRLELLKDIVPGLSRVSVLSNPTNPFCSVALKDAHRGAAALNLQINVVEMSREGDVDTALLTLNQDRPGAALVLADALLMKQARKFAEFMVENQLPSAYTYREHVVAGGLFSYSADYDDIFRRVSLFVDKIFKGARPSDLPVEQPVVFHLVVNLKTAKALGLTLPPSILIRADEVIE